MVLFPLRLRSSSFVLVCLLATGCGGDDVEPIDGDATGNGGTLPPAPSSPTLPSSPFTPPPSPWDAGTSPGSGSKPDAGVADAGGSSSSGGADGGSAGDAGKSDAAVDSGAGLPGFPDLGGILNPPKPDAGTPPSSGGGAGTCGGTTPHGCYTPAAGNAAGCPATSPEIPTGYPVDLSLWDGCNGLKVGAGGTCVWNGPSGATATCICDAGAHWICSY